MKKQYIKPFMNVHTLKVEAAVLAASYPVKATLNDKTKLTPIYSDSPFGIRTKWEWGNGDDSEVD